MALVSEMRQQLKRFLLGRLSVEMLQVWLDERFDAIQGDAAAAQLFSYVEWAFCDLERGASSPEVLKANLERVAVESIVVGSAAMQWQGYAFSACSSSTLLHASAIGSVGRLQILPGMVSV